MLEFENSFRKKKKETEVEVVELETELMPSLVEELESENLDEKIEYEEEFEIVIEPGGLQRTISKGRRPKLTKWMIKRVVKVLEAGNYDSVAIAASGVSKNTYYRWLRQGELDFEAGKKSLHAEFYRSVLYAKAKPEIYASDIVRKALPTDPRLAFLFLQGRYPNKWGKRVVDVGIESSDDKDKEKLNDPYDERRKTSLASLLSAAAERLAVEGTDEGKEPRAEVVDKSGQAIERTDIQKS